MKTKNVIVIAIFVPIILVLIFILSPIAWITADHISEFVKPKSDLISDTGKVKWFNSDKGFGFIVRDDGRRDLFFNREAFNKYGIQTLGEGDKVKFQVVVPEPENGPRANDIELVK